MSDNDTRTPHEIEAEEFAKTLEEMGALEPEKKPEPETADPPPADATPSADAQTTQAPADAGVVVSGAEETELFPGFNALSDEAKDAVKARLAEAEDAKRKADEFEQRWKAQHGQLAPTQRELHQARRAAQEMAQRIRELEQAKPAMPAGDVLAKFKEQYPDEGAALDAISKQFETQSERIARENAELRNMVQGMQGNLQRQQEINTLSQRHPDWQEIDSNEQFKTWLNSTSPYKQALAKSSDAAAVSEVLDDFKRDLALAQALAGQTAGQPAPPATAPKPTRKVEADPNPTARQSAGASASNASSSEADEFAAVLATHGYQL